MRFDGVTQPVAYRDQPLCLGDAAFGATSRFEVYARPIAPVPSPEACESEPVGVDVAAADIVAATCPAPGIVLDDFPLWGTQARIDSLSLVDDSTCQFTALADAGNDEEQSWTLTGNATIPGGALLLEKGGLACGGSAAAAFSTPTSRSGMNALELRTGSMATSRSRSTWR